MQPVFIGDVNIYDKNFPKFGKPSIVGCIGLENLKFFRTITNKNVHYDLSLLYNRAKHKDIHEDEKINRLLDFLSKNKYILSPADRIDKSKIFCYRGLLTCIACTPYENKDPWKIIAVLYKGCIFLCARNTDEKLKAINNMSEKDKLFTSWHKFEQFLLSDSPEEEPNPNQPMDETKEFSLVLSATLNNHKLVYGAEVDGVKCSDNSEKKPCSESSFENVNKYLCSKEFVELKTNRHIEFPNQERNFRRHKTKKWWCQSFLVGIDTIICGFRNDNGIVEELKVYNLKELYQMSKDFWKPNVCFNYLDGFLTYMKRCLVREIQNKYGERALQNLSNLPIVSLMFEWKPKMPVQVVENFVYEDDPILPEWFINQTSMII